MPVVNSTTVVPLGTWSHQQVVSEAMVLTGTLDNEDNVFIVNVRNHLNMHLSHLVDLLNQAASPFYGVYATWRINPTVHDTGFVFLDNISNGTNFIWHSIKRIALSTLGAEGKFFGNLPVWDISRLSQQSNDLNNQHQQTIAYCHHGDEVLIYTGALIATTPLRNGISSPPASPVFTIDDTENTLFTIWGYRQPTLDIPSSGTSGPSWIAKIDLPDKYIKLLIDMICKSILQQRNGHIPQELDASINQGLASLNQNLQQAVQLEQAQFNQRKTGQPQRPIGAL